MLRDVSRDGSRYDVRGLLSLPTLRPLRCRVLCAGCRVREPCLTYALEHRIGDGVWGGLSPTRRAALARRAG